MEKKIVFKYHPNAGARIAAAIHARQIITPSVNR